MTDADVSGQIETQGRGGGASRAREQPFLELKRHHPDVAERIVGSIVVNARHMSDDQMLAQARALYAAEHKAECA